MYKYIDIPKVGVSRHPFFYFKIKYMNVQKKVDTLHKSRKAIKGLILSQISSAVTRNLKVSMLNLDYVIRYWEKRLPPKPDKQRKLF